MKPHPMFGEVWQQLAKVQAVVEAYKLEAQADPAKYLWEHVYVARLDYLNKIPGWDGSLYILKGMEGTNLPTLHLNGTY